MRRAQAALAALARTCPGRRQAFGLGHGCGRSARHPLTVIAVARLCVDTAQFFLCLGQS